MKTELLDAHLTGEANREEAIAVENALRSDESLREVYFRQLRMDAALRLLLGGNAEVDSASFREGVIARLMAEGAETTEDRDFSKSVLTEILEEKEKIIPLRWPDFVKASLVAALTAVAVVLGLQTVDLSDSPTKIVEKQVIRTTYPARIQASQTPIWSNSHDKHIREDGWISNGLLELQSGVVEIAFNSGARVFLEGPAKLSVESENRAFLEAGNLTAEVNSHSTGFTINTPRMNIVDIGTRFGVKVDDTGDTEVHVMEGEVEASRSGGNAVEVLLREGLALRADSRPLSSMTPIPYAGDQFVLTAGPSPSETPAIQFHFDESGGAALVDSGSSPKGGPYDLSLLDGQFDEVPKRAPGFSGGGLVFMGGETLSTYLSSDFRLDDPFTIAFWLKVPPRLGREEDHVILGWGRDGNSWEIGCQTGSGGSLVVRRNDGFQVGSTDLADGNWHHIAVRYIGNERKLSARSHIHLYVDGKLETIQAWNPGTPIEGRVSELRIGDLKASGFPGWIDEITVFDEAISTERIQTLVSK